MNLTQINRLWDEYKSKYDIGGDAQISSVQYDTDKYIEGCFNLLELMDGKYILHLTPRMHTYNESYCKFVLFHEFTHFYDYIKCPYEDKEDMIIWMNAYSEYHACRVTLARFIESCTLSTVHVDKIQIPGPYKEISIRRLLVEALYRCKLCFDEFFVTYQLSDYGNGLRQLMYLLGYLSLFDNDTDLVRETLETLHIYDDNFCALYKALKEMDFDNVLHYYTAITDNATLLYLRKAFRKFYSPIVLSDEEIENITLDNYKEYIKRLHQKMRDLGWIPDDDIEDGEEQAENAAMAAFVTEIERAFS